MTNALSIAAVLMIAVTTTQAEQLRLYVGTYTDGESEGIYLLDFDTATGELKNKRLAATSENPSFVALHANRKNLYAVNETGTGELSAFEIQPASGEAKLLNKIASGGGAPCHLVIDKTGRNLLVANYSGGNVSVTRINDDGSLGEQTTLIQHEGSSVNNQRQKEPHAHSINLDAANRFAVAADLGTDQLLVYRFDPASGHLTKHSSANLKPGSGPRHFTFHPNGKNAYAINELRSTVTTLEYQPDLGELRELQTISTLPRDFSGSSYTAEIRTSANGRFVYGSNRGHDSIAVFRVGEDGRLTLVQIEKIGGKTPRNFTLDPSGGFLLAAGQSTNDIHVFSVNPNTGQLTKTKFAMSVPSPVCLRFAN